MGQRKGCLGQNDWPDALLAREGLFSDDPRAGACSALKFMVLKQGKRPFSVIEYRTGGWRMHFTSVRFCASSSYLPAAC